MGLFDFFRERRAAARQTEFDAALLTALLGQGKATREMAMQVPTVSGGIDLIAGVIAGTPIKLYTEEDGESREVTGDPRVKLLNDETGDALNANDFWRAMVRDYYLGKGAYAYINRRGNDVISLHYVEDKNISIIRGIDPIFKDFDILVNGHRYKPFEFLRVLRNTVDGAEGTPITEESSELIETAWQSLVFEHKLVSRGGNKRGFLKAPHRLDETYAKELREGFNRLYTSGESTIVLQNGIEFVEASNTSVEMQLNENKRTNAEEFAKIFHVSASAVGGHADKNDISALARLAAIPLMTAIQCSLNRDLLLESEKGRYYWAFDTKELLKGDIRERYEAYRTALEANFMGIDEVRFAEDMKPLGLNWIKLGLDDVLYDPQTKQIYTPNTGMTGGLNDPSDDALIPQERRGNDNHDPTNGRFAPKSGVGGLTGGGKSDSLQSSPDGVSATGENRFKRGFSESNLKEHWDGKSAHKNEYPGFTKEQYAERALELIQMPTSENILGYKNAAGQIIRYDRTTNDFVKGKPSIGIATMFKPTDGEKYYQRCKKKEGVKSE